MTTTNPMIYKVFWVALVLLPGAVSAAPDDRDPAAAEGGPSVTEGVLAPPAARTPPPALPPLLGDRRFVEVLPDPPPAGVDVVVPPLVGSLSGCGIVGAPLTLCGTLGTVTAVTSVGSIFAIGANPVLMLALFAGGMCVGIPSLFCIGPLSAAAAGTGAMVATRTYNDRNALPALIAMLPPMLLALVGSVVAVVGTYLLVFAGLGVDFGRARAAFALMSVGLVTSLVAGPVAAFSAVAADLLFGGPFPYDEAAAQAGAGRAGEEHRRKRRGSPRVAMAF